MKKLSLTKETLSALQAEDLSHVAGGTGTARCTFTCYTALNGCATRFVSHCVSYCAKTCPI